MKFANRRPFGSGRHRTAARVLALLAPVLIGGGLVVAASPASADVSSVTVCPDGTNPCTASTSGIAGAADQTYVIRFYTANYVGTVAPGSITLSMGNGTQFPSGGDLYAVHDEGGPDCYPNDFTYGFPVTGGSSVTLDTTYACISPDSYVDVIIHGMTNPATPAADYYAQVSTTSDPTPQSSSNYTIIPGTPPGAPTINSATRGDGRVDLNWTAPVNSGSSPVSDYVVNTYAAGSTKPVVTDTGSTATDYTVLGLTNGKSYTFTVQAANASGTGPESLKSSAAVPATVPNSPSALFARTLSATKAYLRWTDSYNGGLPLTQQAVEEFLYTPPTQFNPPQYTLVRAFAVKPGLRAWTVTGLSKSKRYALALTASNAVGFSPLSTYSNAVKG